MNKTAVLAPAFLGAALIMPVLVAGLAAVTMTPAPVSCTTGPTYPADPGPTVPGPGASLQSDLTVAHANIKTTLPVSEFSSDLDRSLASGPDLVSLNEVAHRSTAQLRRPGYDLWREPDLQVRGDDGTAVMWRTDRWTATSTGRVILLADGPQRWDHDRAATWVSLQRAAPSTTAAAGVGAAAAGVQAGGAPSADPAGVPETVSMVSVHQMINPAKFGPDKPRRQQLYRDGIERLNTLITTLATRGAVFVAGDFNSQYVDDDPWGPRAMLAKVAMTSSMDTLGVLSTHDGGGTIDYAFAPLSAAVPVRQRVVDLASDHHLLLVDYQPAARRTAPVSRRSAGLQNPGGTAPPNQATVSGGPTGATARTGPVARTRASAQSDPSADVVMSPQQWAHAKQILATGRALGVPARAMLVALMVARQESGFLVYANDGLGSDLGPDQHGVAQSMDLAHDAVGSDHGSLGLFQQQWPWWGSIPDLMDPASSATKFYAALLAVPGWTDLPVTEVAQRVQKSAHPDAYADDEGPALQIYQRLLGSADGGSGTVTVPGTTVADVGEAAGQMGGTCPAAGGEPGQPSGEVAGQPAGRVVVPVLGDAFDLHNWGGAGEHWSRWHTGTDFSTGCGTPAVAAHTGTIEVDTSQAWAGPWLVKLTQGPGRLSTWYAHLQKVIVQPGQVVSAGDPIGEVGAEGNATGCHLHFEVHTRGGPIYGNDNVDPTTWLADHLT